MKALKIVENGSALRRLSTSTWQQSRSNPCADSGRRSCTYSLRSLDEKRIQWLPYRLSVSHLIPPCLFPCLSFFPSLLFPHNAHVPDVLCLTFFYILMSPTSSALLFFSILSYFIAPTFLSASEPLRIQFRLEQIDQTTIGIEPTLVIACFARPKIWVGLPK